MQKTAEKIIKNVEHSVPFTLTNLVPINPGKVASLTLANKPGVVVTLLSFDTNEGLSTHCAPGDAMAYVLEGSVKITIGEADTTAKAGEAVVMPANVPHALKALCPYKMLLVMVKE